MNTVQTRESIVQKANRGLEEFIHLIASEANDVCEEESKKTIAPEHIISALKVRDIFHNCACPDLMPSFSASASTPSRPTSRMSSRTTRPSKKYAGSAQASREICLPYLQDRDKKVSKLEQSGLTEEELLAKQEELFAASRAKFQNAQQ